MLRRHAPFPGEPVRQGATWEVRCPVQSHGAAAEQVTTYRLRSRAGDEIGLDVQISQTVPAQALPDPQPGVRARLDTLATTGSGTMELKLSHVVPAIHWSAHSVVQTTVSMQGFEQPMRAELEGTARDAAWARFTAMPAFKSYEEKTSRVIPVLELSRR